MWVDNQILILDPYITQMSPNGRGFKVVGVEKDLSYDSQWIDGMEKFRWIVTIKFLDDNQRVRLHFDHKDYYVKKEKFAKDDQPESENPCFLRYPDIRCGYP